VISEYVGRGYLAEFVAEEDELKRIERKQVREEFLQLKSDVKSLDSELDQFGDFVRALTRAIMLVNGFHPHKGQWRMRHNG
jgi:hypothetical protein